MRPMTMTFVVCSALAGPGMAADTPPLFADAPAPQEEERPDPQFGKTIAAGGAAKGGVGMKCMACHGIDGRGAEDGGIPMLAGLPREYLGDQLRAYADGERSNQIMALIAVRLDAAEIDAVATYYASISPDFEREAQADPSLIQRGGALATTGTRDGEEAVTACTSCHVSDESAGGTLVPPLAGQHASYIEAQLLAWKNGFRGGDALNVMQDIAVKLSEDDIKAVAAYYASLNP